MGTEARFHFDEKSKTRQKYSIHESKNFSSSFVQIPFPFHYSLDLIPQIQLFRHNMTQIVKILQEYVMREAIETCWNDFVENLTTADVDLDILYMSHLKYVNRMMQR